MTTKRHQPPPITEDDRDLLTRACVAYGIESEHILGHRVDGDSVIILTRGGKRVVWQPGVVVKPLTYIEASGVNPAWAKRKPITGGGRR